MYFFIQKICSDTFWSCLSGFLQIGHQYVSFLKCYASDRTHYFRLVSLMLNRFEILLPISLWVHITTWIYISVKLRQEIKRWNNCSTVTDLLALLLSCISLIPKIKRYFHFLRSRTVWNLLENSFFSPW